MADLESQRFQLVIVDYHPVTEEDRRYQFELQKFNLKVPVINVQAWAGLINGDNRRSNRDLLRAAAQVLRRPIPRRLHQAIAGHSGSTQKRAVKSRHWIGVRGGRDGSFARGRQRIRSRATIDRAVHS
jgi:hypothetical protein